MNKPIVFINVGWMDEYKGTTNDPTRGGHGWLQRHDYGHESWNFLPTEGRVYGYVPGHGRVNIRSLAATPRQKSVAGVTVVWVARSPDDRVTYVVGWYLDATVHLDKEHIRLLRENSIEVGYQIEAIADNARLLGHDQRTLVRVPTGPAKGNMGRRPIWYGNEEFRSQVWEFIGRATEEAEAIATSSASPRQQDPELRKQIELAAVRHATQYYRSAEGGLRTVVSVERDNVGWDLCVTKGDVVLRVEVKGLSGEVVCVELTPNEYEKMRSPAYRDSYVIYVVTEALTEAARSHVFSYNADASRELGHTWTTSDGRRLVVQQLTGARLTAQ